MKRELDNIFYPKSVAIIGASLRENSVGHAVFHNIVHSDYQGAVYPINPKYKTMDGVTCYKRIKDLPEAPDLAVIVTPSPTVPDLVKECGEKGTRGLYIISAGFKEAGEEGMSMYDTILKYAKEYRLNIIGPNCLGFINPSIQLNASFAGKMALPGRIAFISQSGALCTSILDWSLEQKFGFSHFVSIGSMIDIGFHDLIDYFGTDSNTSCILIYMESLTNARAFMSAARAFARSKPIIVLKAGKSSEGAKAALTHTGSIAGNDAAYDAAFQRAGIIRVETVAQLFNVAQALAKQPRPLGNGLSIVTNAGGPGILATDYLMRNGGHLPPLPLETITKLNKILPASWNRKNPVDVLGDASAEQYAEAVRACLSDVNVHGVLVILTPQAVTDATDVAQAISRIAAENHHKTILACWMGEKSVQEGRDILEAHGVPTYRFPESAVDAFLRMYSYSKNIDLLYETPPNIPQRFTPQTDQGKVLIEKVFSEEREVLSEFETKQLLSFYGIPINESFLAKTADEAVALANEIGFPVVMKIDSPGVLHKTELKGVVLNLNHEDAVRKAFEEMMARFSKIDPKPIVNGARIEKMHHKKYELLIGSVKDPVFGPMILFGTGGTAVEVYKDRNIALPPVNMALAQRLIEGTKVFTLISGYRGMKSVDIEELKFLIYKFAYLVMDFPEILSVDINPYAVDPDGGVVLDAKIVLDKNFKANIKKTYPHLVISPYPTQYLKKIALKNGNAVLLRPIRPEDEPLEAKLFDYLSKETIYFRFFGHMPKVSHKFLSRLTQIDYDREMAIVAEIESNGEKELIGVVRIVGDAWSESAEYAIVVADNWHRQSLGSQMTDFIIEIAKDKGYKTLYASLLKSNQSMKALFQNKGFQISSDSFDTFYASLPLQ